MSEIIELACFIKCDGGLEIDNADLVLVYEEHMNDRIEIKAKSIVPHVSDAQLVRAIRDALKQRKADSKVEAAQAAAGV
ncbi:hypothetical protein [Paraburkholderia acidisoli]|uniref:Uncharacterized protein n=1 Tax=Paraburkholderia acidisoli TaxID=2571748 RepID=A0A7Z2JJ37_9BURK|nr:hypothetical protein [Paraburkholderia acidisoli]QGZ66309.1 hypothetical protein FAZ98_31440 [Paraburkholderia acidisoli]QGZ66396.1 hypothetical protein FAZ98_31930 [Paraburkholderia acidisoli]